jgi:hypothetical protein
MDTMIQEFADNCQEIIRIAAGDADIAGDGIIRYSWLGHNGSGWRPGADIVLIEEALQKAKADVHYEAFKDGLAMHHGEVRKALEHVIHSVINERDAIAGVDKTVFEEVFQGKSGRCYWRDGGGNLYGPFDLAAEAQMNMDSTINAGREDD